MAEVSDTTSYQWPRWPWKKTDAVDDKATTDEDNPVTINVLENDTNAKGVYKIFPVNQSSDVSLTDGVLTDSVAAAEDYTTSLYAKPYMITLESGATVKLENGQVSYNPNGKFEDLDDDQTAVNSFGYAAYGSYNTDRAKVDVTIKGVTDDDPTTNDPPVANDDTAYLPSYYPYPLPYEETVDSTTATTTDAPLSDDLIYTTLAIGEEGDPYPYPNDVYIDVLANDTDADGDSLHVATIAGEKVDTDPDTELPAAVTLDSGATVTLKDNGLYYEGVKIDYLSSDPLATEGDTTVTASGDADAPVLWEGYPIDTFTYQAKDEHGAESNEATVSIYQSPIYYYDVYYDVGTDPVLDTSTDVGDPSLAVV